MRILIFLAFFSLSFSSWAWPRKKGVETGMASYYADKFHGRKTSNGERFNMNAYTAAHRTLPFNTMLKVTLLSTGKTVIVRVNDRGPHARRRIIDVSKRAAIELGLVKHGSGKVKVEVVGKEGKVTLEPKKEPKHAPTPIIVKAHPKKNTSNTPPKTNNNAFATGKTFSVWGTEKKPQGFGVQVSSYNDLEAVIADAKALINKGVTDTFIQVGWASGSKTYRLVLGEYARREHAENDMKRYKKLGYDGFVKKHL